MRKELDMRGGMVVWWEGVEWKKWKKDDEWNSNKGENESELDKGRERYVIKKKNNKRRNRRLNCLRGVYRWW